MTSSSCRAQSSIDEFEYDCAAKGAFGHNDIIVDDPQADEIQTGRSGGAQARVPSTKVKSKNNLAYGIILITRKIKAQCKCCPSTLALVQGSTSLS